MSDEMGQFLTPFTSRICTPAATAQPPTSADDRNRAQRRMEVVRRGRVSVLSSWPAGESPPWLGRARLLSTGQGHVICALATRGRSSLPHPRGSGRPCRVGPVPDHAALGVGDGVVRWPLPHFIPLVGLDRLVVGGICPAGMTTAARSPSLSSTTTCGPRTGRSCTFPSLSITRFPSCWKPCRGFSRAGCWRAACAT